jgi:uncharacterized protein YndB with AHSA1/START domain
LIDAPVQDVWSYVGDPASFPEWAQNVISVTGLAEVEEGAEFRQTTRTPVGKETTFTIDELEDLHEIKLRCTKSGYYSRWVLTDAQSSTFADVEIGIDPTALQYRVFFGALGKRSLRRIAEQTIDGLRSAVRASRATA